MGADGVVKGFEIGKDIVLCSYPCRIMLEVDQLTLEAAEEIFRHGIVVGIAFAGYTLLDLIDLRLLVECFGSIFAIGTEGKCLIGSIIQRKWSAALS